MEEIVKDPGVGEPRIYFAPYKSGMGSNRDGSLETVIIKMFEDCKCRLMKRFFFCPL